MNGPDHYREAEADLGSAARASDQGRQDDMTYWLGCAQVHMTAALTDAFPGTANSVGRNHLSVYPAAGGSGPLILRFRSPYSVREFIRAFDDGEPVEPFTFDLDYPAVTPHEYLHEIED